MTKEFLVGYRNDDSELLYILHQIEKLQNEVEGVGAQRISAMPGSRKNERPIEGRLNQIEELDQMRIRYTELTQKHRAEYRQIMAAVECLNVIEYMVIIHRYVRHEKWDDVYEAVRYSHSSVDRFHAEALKKLNAAK